MPCRKSRIFQRCERTIHRYKWTAPPTGATLGESVDRDLVVAAQRGDQAAFVDLVRLHGGRFFAIAHRILRDVDRAEDALQEALVIAWRDLPSLRDPDRFDAWVHRLLTNVCIAEAGRERKRINNLYVLPIDDPAAPDERAILVLRHFVGYEPTEIAELLGISAGTIRSRLHHAHRAMRAALEADARAAVVGGASR